MKIGKRTAQLIREAAVLGYVHGYRNALYSLEDGIPKDSEIIGGVLYAASRNKDLYPTLGKVEQENP